MAKAASPVTQPAVSPAPRYLEGELLVQFPAFLSDQEITRFALDRRITIVRRYPLISGQSGRKLALLRSPGRTTADLLAEIQFEPLVDVAEPNFLRQAFDLHPPNDTRFTALWALNNTGQSVNGTTGVAQSDIRFLRAWGMARPGTNQVVVGIIDTGIDPAHPDIEGNLWANPGEIPDNGLDDDQNGYVDDVHGYDFSLGISGLSDSGSHGTHVSGTVAAAGNNAQGVLGVNFQARIMSLKTSSDGYNLSTSAIIEAIQYALTMKSNGVNVVALNASYGGPDYSSAEETAVQAATDSGMVFVAAAGNDSTDIDASPTYPAAFQVSNMIVVAASTQGDGIASFSNYGLANVDIAAPGVNVFSTVPLNSGVTTSWVQQATSIFAANDLEFAGLTASNGVTAQMFDCGLGYATDFPPAVRGNIAFIRRGTITFSEKVSNAIAAGAVAAVVYNHVSGSFNGTLQYASNWIPAVSISQLDGESLLTNLPALGTIGNLPDPANSYGFKSGTSMAAPHVAGAVAFAAMNFPDDTVTRRVERVLRSAKPLPAFAGLVSTGGRLDLARIVDSDSDLLPDWWEQDYLAGTAAMPAADPDGDGMNNLSEWLAGTDPTNAASALRLTIDKTPHGFTNTVSLRWPSAPGRFYRLVTATNLAAGFNLVLRTNIAATPPWNTESNLDLASPFRVYRVEIEP